MKKDIVIIGAGSGGYAAAEMAAKSGFSTAMIEVDDLGGTCLNKGCIPTKALYNEAELIKNIINATEHGVSFDGFEINLGAMWSRKNAVIQKLRSGLQEVIDKNNVELIKGTGFIKDKNHVIVKRDGSDIEIETDYIIISTGSKPEKLNVPGKNLDGVITCEGILDSERKINDIIIIGGGFIGVEMAGILNTFGINVKIVETRKDILNNIDDEIRDKLYKHLFANGIKIYTSFSVKEIIKEKNKLCVKIASDNETLNLYGDTVMMATGRVPVTDNLNLDEIGILYDKTGIIVDGTLRTNISNIFAIGDVTGTMMLAHVASTQGRKVIKNIKGDVDIMDYNEVPYCIYTFPEVAGVGLTEKAARENGIDIKIGYSSFITSGRAQAMGDIDGFVKIICNKDEEIIGVHLFGPHASDVIHEGALAISSGLKIEDIRKCIHGHPTLSECLHNAACNIE